MKLPFLIILFLQSCLTFHGQGHAPSHELFTQLLQKNVTDDGIVDYKSFIRDSVVLNEYLTILSANPPNEKTWSREEQMAYWINSYNAYTIKLVSQYYPVRSIKDIGSAIQIPFINTPWDIRLITVGKERLDLNNVEHGILRKKFNDPRVHMALVCASKSCPILLNEAYDPARLDEQLNKQTRAFLTDEYRNKITKDMAQVSMIFNWYSMDFSKNGKSVRDFINTYSPAKISDDAKITYLEYNWSLNE